MRHLGVICIFVMLSAFYQGADADWRTARNRRQAREQYLLPPKDVQVSEITATSVRLTWSYDAPEEVSYYVIYSRPRNTREGYSQTTGITTTYSYIENLTPNTEYEFIISAVGTGNRRGYSSYPVIATTGSSWDTTTEVYLPTEDTWDTAWDTAWDTTTERYQPEATTQRSWWYTTTERRQPQGLPQQPDGLQASRVTDTSIELTWSYTGTDELLYYVIYYKPTQSRAYSEISGITTTYQRIDGLIPRTEYVFLVAGINSVGRGLPSIPAFVTTY